MRQSAHEAKQARRMAPLSSLTVSFSQKGLNKLITPSADTKDPQFAAGQFADATALGDTLDNWRKEFKQDIDGLFEIISVDIPSCYRAALDLAPGINDAITIQFVHVGQVRPGDEKGHEHFGFNDGISQPFVKIEDDKKRDRNPYPGQLIVNPGVLLLGRTGDETARPDWAKNGSFLAYRQLKQLVPEFKEFLTQAALGLLPIGRFSDEKRLEKMAAYIGARLMGRWTSGCPVVLTPFKQGSIPEDIPKIGNDPKQNNNFDFGPRNETPRRQALCPFAAHVRKSRPRTDLPEDVGEQHAIMRSGIAYGPEVTEFEKVVKTTLFERGLAFVCYQSSLGLGFRFIQKVWCNAVNFPLDTDAQPGFDPIVGQAAGAAREMTGYDAADTSKKLQLPKEFVIAEGGEYLFLPSISTLKKIASGSF
ncbi:DyP-type peroxidase [Phlebopus sp. FC_14]|nr:DyP-type peroxidase [Phlebopus sp. FC_14]